MFVSDLNPEGMVLYQGELWKARLDEGKAVSGEEVNNQKQGYEHKTFRN